MKENEKPQPASPPAPQRNLKGSTRDDGSQAAESHLPHKPVPPEDPLDETSWESFPASDPPAH